jgi:hypothetical protein
MNQHVTSDIATLTKSTPYLGNDHLHVGDVKGLSISNIEHTMLYNPKHTFTLSNILYIPYITKPQFMFRNFIRVTMVSMLCLSLLPCQSLRLTGLLAFLQLLICGIVN